MNPVTLYDFGGPASAVPVGIRASDPHQERSVPLDATRPVIRNFALVRQMVKDAFNCENPGKVHLLLLSNGSEERPATLWQLRRIIS
jgi:hypothetical protein